MQAILSDHISPISARLKREPPGNAGGGLMFNDYSPATLDACKPLGPFVTSNSTAWPSFSDL